MMEFLKYFGEKRVSCFGYGKTNEAIVKRFGYCDVYDDKFIGIKEDGTNRFLNPSFFDPSSSSLEIVTPGMPPNHPLVKSAQNLVSEYDLFKKIIPFSVWISGTNGKTTTTAMTQWLLGDKKAQAGANFGLPLANMDQNKKIWILESSSFAIHYTNTIFPNIYALLPVKPDHLTWHKDFEEYEAAKLKPIFGMREGEVAILPEKYKNIKSSSFNIFYENSANLASYMGIDISKIKFQEPFLLDGVIAMSISKILFDQTDYDLLNSFKIGEHKIEEFCDHLGRIWVDDSKATNIDATVAALKRYEGKRIFIILGGDDKGVDLSELFEELKKYDLKVFAIGSNTEKLGNFCDKFNIEYKLCFQLDIAVSAIAQEHSKDSIALLSPAAASLDQFKSYAHRGDEFKKNIGGLKNFN